jgi:hypothetical protein
MEQFSRTVKGRLNIKNPDMTFCSFLLSLSMFLLSIATFYSHRDFNNEYFNRGLIYNRMVNNPLGYKQYTDINSVSDLQFFLN